MSETTTHTTRFYSTDHCYNGLCEHRSPQAALGCEYRNTAAQHVQVYRETHGQWHIGYHSATWAQRLDIKGWPWERSTEWI